jgi:peptide/nickel transport system permease protein
MTVQTLRSGRARNDGPARRRGALRRTLTAALSTGRGRVGLGLMLLIIALAFIGPYLTPNDPTMFVGPPYAPPSHGLPLGTDDLGRDVLSRLLDGGWYLLLVAAAATAAAVAVGAMAGVIAAYRQGRAGGAIMRVTDVFLAFPQIVFVLLLVSVLGASTWLLIVAVAIVQAPQVARVVYGAAQDVCERDFVKAVALWGVPPRTVIRRQVMPSLTTPLAVEAGLRLGFSIILISGLNFLGFGVQPPNPSWGVMVNENLLGIRANMWGVIAPAIVLALLAVGTNMFADSLARAAFGAEQAEDFVAGSARGVGPS